MSDLLGQVPDRLNGFANRLFTEAAFRLQSSLATSSTRPAHKGQYERVLLVVMGGIGDAVLFSPVVDAVCRGYPAAEVELLVRDETVVPVYSHGFGIHGIMSWSGYWMGRFSDLLRLKKKVRFVEKVSGYDLVIHSPLAHHGVASRFAMALNPRAEHVGFALPRFSDGYTLRLPVKPGFLFDLYLEIPRALGLPADYDRPLVRWPEGTGPAVQEMLDRLGLIDEKLILVFPGGGWMQKGISRLWPVENFAELVARIQDEKLGRVVICGGEGERPLAAQILRENNNGPVDLTGLPLHETFALLGMSSCVVSNDSYPVHVSFGLGVPSVVVFGPTDPALVGNTGAFFPATPEEPCEPCWDNLNLRILGARSWLFAPMRKSCPQGRRCIEEVRVVDVLDAVKHTLDHLQKKEIK